MPKPETGAPTPAPGRRWHAYLRLVAFVQQRLGLPLGPAGLGAILAALTLAMLALATAMALR
ncbi:MAG: hypothetical protein HY303_05540 [Candidatus Wallbacteria bacterium]|nr:hypothetical protein [Candidatus Wallbacteria bacterium]